MSLCAIFGEKIFLKNQSGQDEWDLVLHYSIKMRKEIVSRVAPQRGQCLRDCISVAGLQTRKYIILRISVSCFSSFPFPSQSQQGSLQQPPRLLPEQERMWKSAILKPEFPSIWILLHSKHQLNEAKQPFKLHMCWVTLRLGTSTPMSHPLFPRIPDCCHHVLSGRVIYWELAE